LRPGVHAARSAGAWAGVQRLCGFVAHGDKPTTSDLQGRASKIRKKVESFQIVGISYPFRLCREQFEALATVAGKEKAGGRRPGVSGGGAVVADCVFEPWGRDRAAGFAVFDSSLRAAAWTPPCGRPPWDLAQLAPKPPTYRARGRAVNDGSGGGDRRPLRRSRSSGLTIRKLRQRPGCRGLAALAGVV
jgi:hypothetical protein